MGVTQVTVAVRNPARPETAWEGLFRVDTGAVDCLVPGGRLRELGIAPQGKRVNELVDGSEITFDIGVVQIEFMGEVVGATVVFGADDAEPILGVTALESVGIEIDPRSQRLTRLPRVRLKKAMRPRNRLMDLMKTYKRRHRHKEWGLGEAMGRELW
ncbi:MAG TPA: clan AA aspartic protease [Phycisphaerae bacterium]|nr:clan AA aspartic protease [Phycisphaerae bacterium]